MIGRTSADARDELASLDEAIGRAEQEHEQAQAALEAADARDAQLADLPPTSSWGRSTCTRRRAVAPRSTPPSVTLAAKSNARRRSRSW